MTVTDSPPPHVNDDHGNFGEYIEMDYPNSDADPDDDPVPDTPPPMAPIPEPDIPAAIAQPGLRRPPRERRAPAHLRHYVRY